MMSANVKNAVARVVTSGTASVGSLARLAGHRILIVEDNHFVAHQCQQILTDAGCEVVDIVTTADDAVRVALDRRPRLVLMDIYLPGKRDGIDAAIEIFERFGIRSIFASAPADSAAKARAETARPLAWLPKPFSDRKLLATVESATAHTHAYPSLLLRPAACDEKNAINIGPKPPTRSGSKEESPKVLTELAALKNAPPAVAALASALDVCPARRKMARGWMPH